MVSREWLDAIVRISYMKFRLTYTGELKVEGGAKLRLTKHVIRKVLHQQLKDLWSQTPLSYLRERIEHEKYPQQVALGALPDLSRIPQRRGPFTFIPLIGDILKLACHLDILFFRPEKPGMLFQKRKDEYGGDLDNRLKVFFDALRIPAEQDLADNVLPEADEVPFYCLLEDDSLITKYQVESDTLWGRTSLEPDKQPKDVQLIVQVTIIPIETTWDNIALIN